MKRGGFWRWIGLGVALLCLQGIPALAQVRKMIDLGAPGGAQNFSFAYGINNRGQVVGYYYDNTDPMHPGPYHACLYDNGIWTDLGTLGGNSSMAYGINNHGQIVGGAELPDGQGRAFLYDGGAMTDLGALGGTPASSEARDINDWGQIVGETTIDSNQIRAFLINEGVMLDIGTLGGDRSRATAINNLGQVVGWANMEPGSTVYHAFLYTDGAMYDLGDLGGGQSWAMDINDRGQITGYSHTADGRSHAFLYTGVPGAGGVMTDLGPFPKTIGSGGYSINRNGWIAGQYALSWDTRAFLYVNGAWTDLGTLGWVRSWAYGINDRGQIVGISSTGPSNGHAFLYNSCGNLAPGTLFLLLQQ